MTRTSRKRVAHYTLVGWRRLIPSLLRKESRTVDATSPPNSETSSRAPSQSAPPTAVRPRTNYEADASPGDDDKRDTGDHADSDECAEAQKLGERTFSERRRFGRD